MHQKLLTMIACAVVGSPFASALTVEELRQVATEVATSIPEAIIVEIEVERDTVNATVDSGREFYIRLPELTTIDRERTAIPLRYRRVAQKIREGEPILSLPEAYARAVTYIAGHDQFSRVSTASLSSIEYNTRARRTVIDLDFEGAFAR